MTAVRSGPHDGYDRFVIQFSGPAPRYDVQAQAGGGLLVTLHGASGQGTYRGPTDLQPGLATLRDARETSDADGTLEWTLSLSRAACFHAFVLAGPGRLVIDIQT